LPPPDGTVALVAVPLSTAGGQEQIVTAVDQLRAALDNLPDTLTVEVTGGPAFTADLTNVFDGADVTLLAVTAGVVAFLLLITYRSPFLWIVPLGVVAATEQVTLRAIETIVPGVGINLQDGAVTGITSVLVFGAATDYALLLIARYREELRRMPDRFAASAPARWARPPPRSTSCETGTGVWPNRVVRWCVESRALASAGMVASPATVIAAPIRMGISAVSVGVLVTMSYPAWNTARTSRLPLLRRYSQASTRDATAG
jgi:hypothetical protein